MSFSFSLPEILANIDDGVYVLNRDREVSFINQRASEILKNADEEFRSKLAKAATDRASTRFEYFHASIGRWFEHQTYANPEGGFTVISRDVTGRRHIEECRRR